MDRKQSSESGTGCYQLRLLKTRKTKIGDTMNRLYLIIDR